MTAYGLLQENPEPSKAEIREALKDTLCRCAGYPSIEGAVQAAGYAMRTGKPVPPPNVSPSSIPLKIIGQSSLRPDGADKVTGDAVYTDDLKFPGMLHAAVKRSGIPHGFLKKLNIDPAKELAGVKAVLTAEDIPGQRTHGLVIHDWPSIIGVGERVRYVGDAVAIVAAETREIALQALELIETEYQLEEVVADPVRAKQPDAPQLHETGNLLKHIKVRKGDVKNGFAEADVILEQVFHTPTLDHAFLEPECTVARPVADERMEIYVGSQIPYADRYQVALALGWEETRVQGGRAADGRRIWRQRRYRRTDPRRLAGQCHTESRSNYCMTVTRVWSHTPSGMLPR